MNFTWPDASIFALPARNPKPQRRSIIPVIDFEADVNPTRVAPGQILRLEGSHRGIGWPVNYAPLSDDASHPAGIHR